MTIDQSAAAGRMAPPWPSALRGWSAVAVFCVAAVLSYTDRQILSLLVDPIRADLKITDTQIGLLQGVAFALVYSVAGIPFGRLADMVARRSVILIGIAIWSAGTLLCGFSTSFWMMFAGRFVVGIGEAALAPAAVSMIADLFEPRRRGLATGTFMMGMVVGGGAAIAVGGAVLTLASAGAFQGLPVVGHLAPWRTALVLLGLAGLPLMAAVAALREPERRLAEVEAGRPEAASVLSQLRLHGARLAPLILGCGLMSVGDFALFSWAPAILARNYAMAPAEIGGLLGAILVATGVAGTLSAGFLSDRLTVRRGPRARLGLVIVTTVIALPGSLVWLTGAPFQLLVLLSIWSLFSTMTAVGGVMAIQEVVPNTLRGLSISLIACANIMLGLGLGTTLAGFLADKVFNDPLSLAHALTLCVTPAAILALTCFAVAFAGMRVRPTGAC